MPLPKRKHGRRHVALFGGSFNPPHLGHVEMGRWLLAQAQVDEVWVIPCFLHPFEKTLAPFDARYAMTLFAFAPCGRGVFVSDVERELGGVSHTIRTVQHVCKLYPKYQFSLVRGGDIEVESAPWKDADEIEKLVTMITVPRGPGSPIPNISSTDVRACIQAGKPFDHLVPKSVGVYIITHDLYR
ncbi:MAG: nicotinate-nicotinamide nucleotide adenylyltransferase [Deltaproteobacteria bacterium]|nr:nicotinate-nicotinamide nucleotide adenylyltransferase [Deltaproteobacteria bacterium]